MIDTERQHLSRALPGFTKGWASRRANRPESRPAADAAAAERNEAALVAKALRGDGPAFEALLRPYERRTYCIVLRIAGNPADAADAYQDAVLAAFENIGRFRQGAAFGTWLYRIAVNCALMRRRTATRHPLIPDEDVPQFNWMGMHAQPVHDWTESAGALAERAELRVSLTSALGTLPAIDRAIVWMKDAEGLSHEEIAAATSLSVLATRTRLHRARLRLRTRLTAHLDGSASGEEDNACCTR